MNRPGPLASNPWNRVEVEARGAICYSRTNELGGTMKRSILMMALLAGALGVRAEQPLRVAVLEFQDQTGQKSDALLGGAVAPGAMAEKGVFVLGKLLANRPEFTLVDRRDLIDQMERLQPKDLGEATPLKPSFLQAAQAVNADLVLRGSLQALSPGKQTVNLGGQRTEQVTLAVRVGVEALDATDGTVVGMTDATIRQNFRQTAALSTELSEDDVLSMMERAVAQALPELEKALNAYQTKLAQRTRVKLTIKTTADPALVEIDGLLVGTTPIEGLEVYPGDHSLAVTKPGYQAISKKLQADRSLSLEVPMLREKLSAEELKAIYEKGQLSIYQGLTPNILIQELK